VGGLLVPLGDALGGQQLAQPGMLVVHVTFSSCWLSVVLVSIRLARTVRSSWIVGPRNEARLPMPKARRSQHPSSAQHQPVMAARFGLDFQVELDQALGASGGERRHDPPGSAGQEF
jgi:hypothetical protein